MLREVDDLQIAGDPHPADVASASFEFDQDGRLEAPPVVATAGPQELPVPLVIALVLLSQPVALAAATGCRTDPAAAD